MIFEKIGSGMLFCGFVLLSLPIPACADSVSGGVFTNLCGSTSSLGHYSNSCSSGNSTFTVDADTGQSAFLTWGARISATDSSVDPTVTGNFGYALIQWVDLVTVSASTDIFLHLSVDGTTTNINGEYARYHIIAGLYQNSQLVDPFPDVTGTGPGTVDLDLENHLIGGGSYALQLQFRAEVCFTGCLSNDAAAKAGESVSDVSDFFDTFRLTSVTTNGATVIDSNGINLTDLSSTPEPDDILILSAPLAALFFWQHKSNPLRRTIRRGLSNHRKI